MHPLILLYIIMFIHKIGHHDESLTIKLKNYLGLAFGVWFFYSSDDDKSFYKLFRENAL